MFYKGGDNPFRDSIGNFRTQSLFLETNVTDNASLFTLKDDDYEKDGQTYPSLKRIYLSYDDPTEWQFVEEVFGNWRHWERICGNQVLLKYITQWRNELEIKLRSKGIRSVIGLSKDKESAAKWLAEGKWNPAGRGRPSKDEVERQKRVASGIEQELNDHWTRLMTDTNETKRPN